MLQPNIVKIWQLLKENPHNVRIEGHFFTLYLGEGLPPVGLCHSGYVPKEGEALRSTLALFKI
jgi:hypothetical protein